MLVMSAETARLSLPAASTTQGLKPLVAATAVGAIAELLRRVPCTPAATDLLLVLAAVCRL